MQAARESLGLPPPRQSSNFWAHVMENEKNGLNPSQSTLPLLTPLDKNATATRLLLHDTQANLEKFSGKVDKLLEGFSEAKSEIKLVKTLFERDREALVNDVIDLVNRCQTQIQNSLGSPAQSSVVDQFTKEVSRLLENLDKRLEAMQTLSQTHAQSLQTQIQAIQVIQEQQCTILSTLTPLMPLLQAIPLHIDLAKNSVMDALQKHGTGHSKSVQTSPILQTPGVRNSMKRSRAYSRSGDMAASISQKNKRFCEAREVTIPPSGPSTVRNRNNPDTPHPDSRRPSLRSNNRGVLVDRFQTPGQNSKAIIDDPGLRNSLTPSKHHSTRPPHISALGDRANTSQPGTTEMHTSTDTLGKLINLGCNTSIQSNRTPPKARPSPSDILSMNRKEANPSASQISVLTSQKTKDSIALKKSSTYVRPPQLGTSQPSGTLTHRLRTAMTLLPSKSGFAPPRRRRSPPKEGRRFIPLLDSEDESSIASP